MLARSDLSIQIEFERSRCAPPAIKNKEEQNLRVRVGSILNDCERRVSRRRSVDEPNAKQTWGRRLRERQSATLVEERRPPHVFFGERKVSLTRMEKVLQ